MKLIYVMDDGKIFDSVLNVDCINFRKHNGTIRLRTQLEIPLKL